MSLMKPTAPIKPGLYRHDKSGREYLVLGVGVDSSSASHLRGQQVVVYRPRSPLPTDPAFYSRPVPEFANGFSLLVSARPVATRCTCGS